MILDMIQVFLMTMGAIFCAVVVFLVLANAWDGFRARQRVRRMAKMPPPLIIHLSVGARLGDLPRSKAAISRALGRVDDDIDDITRQIEEQN